MTEGQSIAVFSIAGTFILTAIFNILGYFLKKKDTKDTDNEKKIIAVGSTIQEMRNEQERVKIDLQSLKAQLNVEDTRIDHIEVYIRNLQEALRKVGTEHQNCEGKQIDFGRLLDW